MSEVKKKSLTGDILLESGTNELELLVFEIGGVNYAVNVAKVQELIDGKTAPPIVPIPNSDKRIAGMFSPRGQLITVIDLAKCFSGVESLLSENEKGTIVICHFNNITTAFTVDKVAQIKRFSWKDIISPKEIATTSAVITGIVNTEDTIISILDLEHIMTEIDVNNGLKVSDIKPSTETELIENKSITVLMVDDSKMLNKLICDSVSKVGMNVISCIDGEDAWDRLITAKRNGSISGIDCIVSDIEMPNKDGLSLCRDCKKDDVLSSIPFILFSSLVDESMKIKGSSVGADSVFSKPDINDVIMEVQRLVKEYRSGEHISDQENNNYDYRLLLK